jgi:hypothetical protein
MAAAHKEPGADQCPNFAQITGMVSYLACPEGGDTIEVTVIGYAFVEVWLGVVHLRPSKTEPGKGRKWIIDTWGRAA